jgi:tRNA (guanine10-N2)-dimethyltransferase
MALLVELSGEVLDLASHEAWTTSALLSGMDAIVLARDGNVMVLEAPGVEGALLASRLGLSHHVSDQAMSGNLENAIDLAASIDIGDARSFRVRVHRSGPAQARFDPVAMEVEVGGRIKDRTGSRVDLDNPEAEVRLLMATNAHAGLLGGSVDRKAMEGRAVKHRPFSHPVSIHPKYARAMLNLASIPPKGTFLDPFCGTGGILIEGSLLGFNALGSDIDPRMVEGSMENLHAQGLEAEVREADVTEADEDMRTHPDAIVTDPPYGRSTSLHGGQTSGVLLGLYRMSASCLLPEGRLVVCLPSLDMLPADDVDFRLSSVYPMKVHKSLTRHVCVLVRNPDNG